MIENQFKEYDAQLVIVTVGLPASGKTTWALEYIKDKTNTVRVNKDSIRAMVFNGQYSKEWEDFVCDIRDKIINHALVKGYNVVVDDTNFEEKHVRRIRAIAEYHGVSLVVKDFTDVSKEECLERNKNRSNPVPDEVIHRMHERYILKDFEHKRKFYPSNPRQG